MSRRSSFVKDDRFILEQDISLPECIICDLDGTLALATGRDMYSDELIYTDKVNQPIKDILTLYNSLDVEIIFMSGRMETAREATESWLRTNDVCFEGNKQKLYMRKAGDYRKDSIVKQELYEEYIKGKYYINFILDDRSQVVKMWRDLGLTCLQVYYGDF